MSHILTWAKKSSLLSLLPGWGLGAKSTIFKELSITFILQEAQTQGIDIL